MRRYLKYKRIHIYLMGSMIACSSSLADSKNTEGAPPAPSRVMPTEQIAKDIKNFEKALQELQGKQWFTPEMAWICADEGGICNCDHRVPPVRGRCTKVGEHFDCKMTR